MKVSERVTSSVTVTSIVSSVKNLLKIEKKTHMSWIEFVKAEHEKKLKKK